MLGVYTNVLGHLIQKHWETSLISILVQYFITSPLIQFGEVDFRESWRNACLDYETMSFKLRKVHISLDINLTLMEHWNDHNKSAFRMMVLLKRSKSHSDFKSHYVETYGESFNRWTTAIVSVQILKFSMCQVY